MSNDLVVGKVTPIKNEIVFDTDDRSEEADKLEALVAEIKSITESPYLSDKMKLSNINAAIQDHGY